jgi:hypothetical protein
MSHEPPRPLPDLAQFEHQLERLQALRDALVDLHAKLEYAALELRLRAALERDPR